MTRRRRRARVLAVAAAAHEAEPRWFVGPLLLTLAALPALIAVATPLEHVAGAALAYGNLLLIGLGAVYFVRQHTLQGLIPVLFLAWLAASWPLSSIYFATQAPDAVYTTMSDDREFLYRNAWMQVVVATFLATYLSTLFLSQGRYVPWSTSAPTLRADRRVATIVLWIVMSAISLHAVSKVRPFPDVVQYVIAGMYNYLEGLMLMVGVLFLRLPMHTRLRAIAFMAVAGAFYTLGNARGLAALPAALFFVGFIFLSEVRQPWKMWVVIGFCVALPVALVIGDTTRRLTGTIGFEDLGWRLQAFTYWQDVLWNTPVLPSTFGRLFFVGGHSIVTLSPERYSYVAFDLVGYLSELLSRLVPAKLVYEPFYSGNLMLKRYDFLINEETSVPISMIGSLYMLGGIVPVAIGGAVIALVHSLVGRVIAAASRRSPHMGLFVFGMIAANLIFSPNVDLITDIRTLCWRVAFGLLAYQVVIRPFVRMPSPRRRPVARLRWEGRRPAAVPSAPPLASVWHAEGR